MKQSKTSWFERSVKRLKDLFHPVKDSAGHAAVGARYEDRFEGPPGAAHYIRGDVTIVVRDSTTGEETRWERHNLVVKDASILLAALVKDSSEPPFGIYALAMGTGDTGWDPMNPPAPTTNQRALYSEIARKTLTSTFIDAGGLPTALRTNVVDFTASFSEAEAVGPLVEMGLIGGNISTNLAVKNPVSPPNGPYNPLVDMTAFETLLNYLTFKVINKPANATLTITWRLTF